MQPIKPVFTAAKYMRLRLAKHVIARSEIVAKLKEAVSYPLTIVRAGAGYGKSTAINMAFPEYTHGVAWLNLSEQENDIEAFLYQIVRALERIVPAIGEKIAPLLRLGERKNAEDYSVVLGVLAGELDKLASDSLIIILEDFHLVSSNKQVIAALEEFIAILPEKIHLVISTREKVFVNKLPLWQAKGEALVIDQEELSFSSGEIQQLFLEKYNLSLGYDIAARLAEHTEGWVMAIQMVARNYQGSVDPNTISKLPTQISELFEFLLEEHLETEPEMVRNFLRYTAHLELLNINDCNYILGITNSEAILKSLESRGLFTFGVSTGIYRYHQLFQEYLINHFSLPPKKLMTFHNKAASYYWEVGLQGLAVEHFLRGSFFNKAAELIRLIYRSEFTAGHHKLVEKWLKMYPQDIVKQYPDLILCQGELYRLAGDYPEALKVYEQALREFRCIQDMEGLYHVNKAIALVYLDTVQPVLAEQRLNEALSYAETLSCDERSDLLRLIAENNINLGKANKAAELLEQLGMVNFLGGRSDAEARMYLRTGRLLKAKNLLNHHEYPVDPGSLRDTPLLLSLINSFLGLADEAWGNAHEALSSAVRFNRFFIQAMANIRLGHAKQLQSWTEFHEAEDYYQQALEMISQMGIERIKAEAFMGLCLLYGHNGHVEKALQCGMEGIRVAERVKDDWTVALLRLSMAIVCVVNKLEQAEAWLSAAGEGARYCDDQFLVALTLFWQIKHNLNMDDHNPDPAEMLQTLLNLTKQHGYDCIFYQPCLFGLRDVQEATPILSAGKLIGECAAYAAELISKVGASADSIEQPSHTLRIQTLGAFKVWRGLSEVTAWPRENAKRLLQYLTANRTKYIHKEEIISDLFGERFTDNDFKVAMNALISTLEPGRTVRSTSYYIIKQRSAVGKHRSLYGLNSAGRIIVDADDFENLIRRANRVGNQDGDRALQLYCLALDKYRGDFLSESAYEDWAESERQRLLMLYLTTAEKTAEMLCQKNRYSQCLEVCNKILNKDPLWEPAYGLSMRAYVGMGNRSLAVKTYQNCKRRLEQELGIEPTKEISGLYFKIINEKDGAGERE